ncbi:TPA: hypothetical protein OT044_004442 [Citrobacter koseri]|uniref:hypothetical protein n=1 Tax=Klebsiella pneumoniae TaxID=573 RepID=UPI0009B937E5|nr:hypothetical protein [Klebsiella pneumoniae]SLP10446.1 Uncharacterised protein [Klebsiella pneumoniae]HBS7955880.1 hypothetical protein [Klebsiella pneumoniae]HBW8611373.1 hypothetical protein [Klebsiella pneumoniae]HCT5370223.1 hypothetical protein [Citrobacter koseri]
MILKRITILFLLSSLTVNAMGQDSIRTDGNTINYKDNDEKSLLSSSLNETISYKVTVYERNPKNYKVIKAISGVFDDDSKNIKELANKNKYRKVISYDVNDGYTKLNKFKNSMELSSEYNEYILSKSFVVGVSKVNEFIYDISLQEFKVTKGDNKKIEWTYGIINRVFVGYDQSYRLEILDKGNISHVYLIKF